MKGSSSKPRIRTSRSQTLFSRTEIEKKFGSAFAKQQNKFNTTSTSYQFNIPLTPLQSTPKSLDIIVLSSDEEHIKEMKQMSEKLGHHCIVTESLQECKRLVESTSNGVLFFVCRYRNISQKNISTNKTN